MPKLKTRSDRDLVFNELAHDDLTVKRWAYIANSLGYAWCGGTKTEIVGEDFSVKKNGTQYEINANYHKHDPYSKGDKARDRLKMTMRNIKHSFEPDSIKFGEVEHQEMEPKMLGVHYLENRSSALAKLTASYGYSLSTSTAHNTNYSFSEGVDFGQDFNFGLPEGPMKYSIKYNIKLNATQGWFNTKTEQETQNNTVTASVDVNPGKRAPIYLYAVRTKSTVSYDATVNFNYLMTLNGFMRYKGNAQQKHPKNRPSFPFTFGESVKHPDVFKPNKSAVEHLHDLYSKRGIEGYNRDWDWAWVDKNFPQTKDVINELYTDKPCMEFQGKFESIFGENVTFEIGKEEDITEKDNVESVTAYSSGPAMFSAASAAHTIDSVVEGVKITSHDFRRGFFTHRSTSELPKLALEETKVKTPDFKH